MQAEALLRYLCNIFCNINYDLHFFVFYVCCKSNLVFVVQYIVHNYCSFLLYDVTCEVVLVVVGFRCAITSTNHVVIMRSIK